MNGDSFTLAGRRARVAIVTVSAGALALLAGCSAGTTSSTAATSANPRTALILAADHAAQLSSMDASFSQTSTDATQNFSGTVQMQLKPTLVAEVAGDVAAGGQSMHLTEILTGTAIYLKLAELSQETGKPWTEIPFSGLPGKSSALMTQLMQGVENDNPASQARMVSASKNVHVSGTQMVDGVETTKYEGSYTPAAALAALTPSERRTLGADLKGLTGQVRYTEWIDAQHYARKTIVTETVNGQHVTLTFNITAINQAVHVKLPPRRKVAVLPAGSL
jgi:hypothetical protein